VRNFILLLFLVFTSSFAESQKNPIDLKQSNQYFKEIKKICDSDNGRLWGKNLWAPILLIDKETRFVVANEADNEGNLKKNENVFTGYFPKDKGIANSTTEFGGKLWMMVMYPLPDDKNKRNQLCMHELYHRLQGELKLKFGNYNNDHMDNMDARILLKLEWMALEYAINGDPEKRIEFLRDALVFRNYRRVLYPGKNLMENEIEIHEGIAEYTGTKLCSENNSEFKTNVMNAKEKYRDTPTFVRSFSYYSGLLYGYILDQLDTDWRSGLNPKSDLGLMVRTGYNIELPVNLKSAFEKSRSGYDYDNIFKFERNREDKRQEMLDVYRFRFTRDTVLTLYIANPNIVFNPYNLIPLDSLGTVYPNIKIISDWGILQVNAGGCLFDWKKAVVPARNIKQVSNKLVGDGWELELNDNWKLVKDNSNYKLSKK
jgi:hypothetical protein